MAVLLNLPVLGFTDDNGNVLAGGKVYFYKSGTSELLETFSDDGLTTANTNPVILNAAGRPQSGAIYLKAADYKVVVKNASDIQVGPTMDPVHGGDDITIVQWGAPVSDFVAALPGSPSTGDRVLLDETNSDHPNEIAEYNGAAWAYSETAETGQTVFVQTDNTTLIFDGTSFGRKGAPALINSPYYPLFSGAVGEDSAHDDSMALNAAIDYAASQKRILKLDRNFYATGLVLKSNSMVEGIGCQPAITCISGSAAGAVLSLSATSVVPIDVHNLCIDGNEAGQTNAIVGLKLDRTGIATYAPKRDSISDIFIENCSDDGFYIGYDTADAFFSRINIYNCDGRGLYVKAVTSGAADFILDQVIIGNCKLQGAEFAGSTYQISNMKIWGSGQYSATDPYPNYYFHNAQNVTGSNLLSQEASGDGIQFFNSAGSPVGDNCLLGLVSDGDGVIAGYGGIRMTNATRNMIRGRVGKSNAALAGSPDFGVYFARDAVSNDVEILTDSNVTSTLSGAGIGVNRIVVNANHRFFAELMDDFTGDSLDAAWGEAHGSDGSVVAPTINSQVCGVCRLVTGAGATTTMTVNGVQLHRSLAWEAVNQGLMLEVRLKLSSNSNVAVFVGFTDQVSSLEMPFNSAESADTITSNASDGFGVMYDTAMATDHWWLVGVKADNDATAQDSGVAPSSSTYVTWQVICDSSGNATFYRNGAIVGTQMSAAVTASTLLTPVVAAFSRSGASVNVDIDYIRVGQQR